MASSQPKEDVVIIDLTNETINLDLTLEISQSPGPEVLLCSQPELLHSPEPEVVNLPEPEALHSSHHETRRSPRPSETQSPELEVLHSSQPTTREEVLHSSQPEALQSPRPNETESPELEVLHSSQPDLWHSPGPGVLDSPELEVIHSSQSKIWRSPEPEVLHLSDPEISCSSGSETLHFSEHETSPKPKSKPKPKIPRNTKPDKEAKKLEQAEEKLRREANRANAANKALENCVATIDKNLLAIIGDPEEIVLKTVSDENLVRYRITQYPDIENSISWHFKRAEVVNGKIVTNLTKANWIVVIMMGKEYIERLNSHSLERYIVGVKSGARTNVILLVYGLSSWLKSENAKRARDHRKRFKSMFEGDGEVIDTLDVTTDRMDLRLLLEIELKHKFKDWNLHIDFCEKTIDIISTIVKYTRSVAKSNSKPATGLIFELAGLDWALSMDKDKSVDPTKNLTELWVTQLQQFPQVTLPIAKAIAVEYPSPCALLDQYNNLTSSEAENLLAELYVQRNLKRKIGNNISKRIHRFMSCDDPDVHLTDYT